MPNPDRTRKITDIVSRRQSGLAIILEDIHDPHNAAAIYRTADAFGIHDIRLVFGRETPYDPKEIGKQSSSSANKWMDFTVYRSVSDCVAALRDSKHQLIATVLNDQAEDLMTADLTGRSLAVWFGNEHSGLSAEAVQACDRQLTIPMQGMVQSLNVSVSAAVVLYEITRQRMRSIERYRYGPHAVTAQARRLLKR